MNLLPRASHLGLMLVVAGLTATPAVAGTPIVLPPHLVHGANRVSDEEYKALEAALGARLAALETTQPIAYRSQNGGDYDDDFVLKPGVAEGTHGLTRLRVKPPSLKSFGFTVERFTWQEQCEPKQINAIRLPIGWKLRSNAGFPSALASFNSSTKGLKSISWTLLATKTSLKIPIVP